MGIFATITNSQLKDASDVTFVRQLPHTSKFYNVSSDSCACVVMSLDENIKTLDFRVCVREYFQQSHFVPDIAVPPTIDLVESTATQSDSKIHFSFSERGFIVDYLNQKIILAYSPSFIVEEGDIFSIGLGAKVITNVISQTELQFSTVDDLIDGTGIVSQKMQTIDLTELQGFIGSGNVVKINEAIPFPVIESLVYLEDDTFESEINIGTHFRVAYQISGDGVTWTDSGQIPVSFESKIRHKNPSLSSGSYRIRFFAKNVSGDGVAKLKGWRAYFHKLTPEVVI